jgi:predicted nucleic acid-binding protein
MAYLLDTNSIIYYLQGALSQKAMLQFDKIVDEQVLISVITKIEFPRRCWCFQSHVR